MSIEISKWVWRHSEATGAARLALLALADFADGEGVAWPSVATLAGMVKVSTRHMRRLLKQLEGMGELAVVRDGQKRRTNRYRVLVRPPRGEAVEQGKGNSSAEELRDLGERGEKVLVMPVEVSAGVASQQISPFRHSLDLGEGDAVDGAGMAPVEMTGGGEHNYQTGSWSEEMVHIWAETAATSTIVSCSSVEDDGSTVQQFECGDNNRGTEMAEVTNYVREKTTVTGRGDISVSRSTKDPLNKQKERALAPKRVGASALSATYTQKINRQTIITIFKSVFRYQPKRGQTDVACRVVQDGEIFRQACQLWLMNGHNLFNMAGILEWYQQLQADAAWRPYQGETKRSGPPNRQQQLWQTVTKLAWGGERPTDPTLLTVFRQKAGLWPAIKQVRPGSYEEKKLKAQFMEVYYHVNGNEQQSATA